MTGLRMCTVYRVCKVLLVGLYYLTFTPGPAQDLVSLTKIIVWVRKIVAALEVC